MDGTVWTKPINSDSWMILKDNISTSAGMTSFVLYTSKYGVSPIDVLTVVRYPNKAYGNISCQPRCLSIIFLKIFLIFLFAASTAPLFGDDKKLNFDE